MNFFKQGSRRVLYFIFIAFFLVLILLVTVAEDKSLDKEGKRYLFYRMVERTAGLREKISDYLLLAKSDEVLLFDKSQTNNISDYTEVLKDGQIVMYDAEHKMIVILVPEVHEKTVKWKCQGNDISVFPTWCFDGMKL